MLQKHIKSNHTIKSPSQNFNIEEFIQTHIKQIDTNKNRKCPICYTFFREKHINKLQKHLQLHHQIRLDGAIHRLSKIRSKKSKKNDTIEFTTMLHHNNDGMPLT